MDIYRIIETLQRIEESELTEGQMKELMWRDAERMNLKQFCDRWGDEDWVKEFWQVINEPIDEGTGLFKYGSIVTHPKYGTGKVVKVWPNDMITVDFPKFPDPIDKKPGIQGNFMPGDTDYVSLKPAVAENDIDDDEGGYVDLPDAHVSTGSFNRSGFNRLRNLDDYYEKVDYIDRQLANVGQQQNWPELKQRRLDLAFAARKAGLVPEGTKFSFANPKQKPGDQVRGTEIAKKKKSGEHPFKGRLVGAAESRSIQEEWADFINEYGATGMSTGGTISPSSNSTGQAGATDQAKQQELTKQTSLMSKNLQNLKGKVPGLNVSKVTTALTKASSEQELSDPEEKAIAQLAPAMSNIAKNPNLSGQLKQLIDRGEQQAKQAAAKQQQSGTQQQTQQPQQQGTV